MIKITEPKRTYENCYSCLKDNEETRVFKITISHSLNCRNGCDPIYLCKKCIKLIKVGKQ